MGTNDSKMEFLSPTYVKIIRDKFLVLPASFFWTVDFQIMCRATCDCMDSLLPAAFEVWAVAVVPCTTPERHVDSIPNSCLPTYVYICHHRFHRGKYIYICVYICPYVCKYILYKYK